MTHTQTQRATPAPAATPGVPDSVRALSEAFAETACCASCTTPMDCYQGKPCRLEPVGSGSGVVDHEFKSHPDVFWPAARGEKTFEYRRDDRGGYEVGQTVRLRCYDLTRGYHDTAPLDRRVTNILRGGEFELPMGYCILSLAPLAAQPAGQSTDDGTDRCEVCNKPLIAGQRVMQDVELGTVHAACCGPEREAYVKDVETGEPLGPNDPIPQGYVYEGEEPAGQAGDAGAVKPCAWVGGNDTCYCRTCGAEYRYGREDKPPCPRTSAPDSTRTGAAETERPDGAIHNGREHLRRLGLYGFTANDGHVLGGCEDYIGAQQCFEVMAEALAARPEAPSGQAEG